MMEEYALIFVLVHFHYLPVSRPLSIYIGSRTILFMAQEKMTPRFLGETNRRGVPIAALFSPTYLEQYR